MGFRSSWSCASMPAKRRVQNCEHFKLPLNGCMWLLSCAFEVVSIERGARGWEDGWAQGRVGGVRTERMTPSRCHTSHAIIHTVALRVGWIWPWHHPILKPMSGPIYRCPNAQFDNEAEVNKRNILAECHKVIYNFCEYKIL